MSYSSTAPSYGTEVPEYTPTSKHPIFHVAISQIHANGVNLDRCRRRGIFRLTLELPITTPGQWHQPY